MILVFRLNLYSASLIALLTAPISFGILYALTVNAPRQEVEEARKQTEEVRAEIEALSGFATKGSEVEPMEQLQQLQGTLEGLFPEERADAEMIDALEEIGQDAGVRELSIQVEGGMLFRKAPLVEPAKPSPSAPPAAPKEPWLLNATSPEAVIQTYRLRVAFEAGYAETVRFLDRLGKIVPFVAIEALTIDRHPPRSKVAMTLRAHHR